MPTSEQERIRDDVAAFLDRDGHDRSRLIVLLQEVQGRYRHISPSAMQALAQRLGMQPAEVYGVVSFYPYLTTEPVARHVVRLCRGLCCDLAGKAALADQLESVLGVPFGGTTPDGEFTLEWADCLGACDQGPALSIDGRIYTRVAPCLVAGIIEACRDGEAVQQADVPGWMDSVADPKASLSFASIELGSGLSQALDMTPMEAAGRMGELDVIGRRGQKAPTYVVCNTDAVVVSPSARVLLSTYADHVVEGMTVAAYALGASRGVIYLRAELAYLRGRVEACLRARRGEGLLGDSVLGRAGFGFDVEVRVGAGKHVGADGSALVAFLEGARGEPRSPATEGEGAVYALGTPESFARVTAALAGDGEAASLRLYAVLGDCERPGLYELRGDATIAEALALAGGASATAVQLGGPSGRLVTADGFDSPLGGHGAGGTLVAFGEGRDLLNVVRMGLQLSARQSCGQCAPCREGVSRLLDGVERMGRRSCPDLYLAELRSLARTMQLASKCAIGRTAPNAFLSYLETAQRIG